MLILFIEILAQRVWDIGRRSDFFLSHKPRARPFPFQYRIMAGPGRRELLLAFKEKYLKGIRSNAGLRGASGFLFFYFLRWDTSFWFALPSLERLADIYLYCSFFTMISRLHSRLLSLVSRQGGLDVSSHDLGYRVCGARVRELEWMDHTNGYMPG